MAVYNVHAGHCPQGQGAHGAVGILKESVEDRIVKDEVIRLLREKGHTVYDCTCDENVNAGTCLTKIVKKCNQHPVTLDISIHLNSGKNDYVGDGVTGGVEVWCYDGKAKEISDKICKAISDELGVRNRGTKYSRSLYVLSKTQSKAILIECCFVDDADDAKVWDAKRCAKAIVEALCGEANTATPTQPKPEQNPVKPVEPPKPTPKPVSSKIDVEYAVMIEGGRKLPAVVNTEDYAGIKGKKIVGLAMKVNNGARIKYRVTTVGGKTYPWVTGYNWSDHENGYAGDGRNAIAKVECYLYSPNADKYIYYKVSPVNRNYYPAQRDTEVGRGMDGYAGSSGVAIDRFQAWIG